MFNFLNPTILFALAAGLIPLIIHLLNRRRKKVVRFSTIHFLKQMARKEMRRLRIRQILLLLVRTLIIILLVLVFARPTLRTGGNLLAGRTASEVVVIIDNSLSLNSLEVTGNLLEKVRQRWRSLERAFRSGDRITVMLGVQPTRVLAERQGFSSGLWEKVSKDIQPGYLTGNLTNAVLRAGEIFQKSGLYNKELYLISDFQKNGLQANEVAPLVKEWQESVNIFCLPVYHQAEENISVDTAAVVNRLVEKNQSLKINAVVRNQHPENHLTSLVSLILNGNRVGQQNVSVGPQEQKSVVFQTTLQSSGMLAGYVESESDVLLEDNRYYFNFYVPENVKILHLTKQTGRESYIPVVLKPAMEKGLFDYDRKNLSSWPTIDFLNYRAVILEGLEQIPQGLTNRLKQYTDRGNGLLIVPGDNLVPGRANELLEELNLGRILQRKGHPGETGEFVTMGRVNWEHPIFEGLFEKRETLNPIMFNAYYLVKPSGKSESIIRLQNGDPLLVAGGQNSENAYLLAAPLSPQWTNLVVRGFVVPLFYRLLYYAVTRNVPERTDVRVGDTFSEIFRMVRPPYTFVLKRPSGVEEKITPVFKGSDILLQVKRNVEPGNYQIWQENHLLALYSVNHSPGESEQNYLSRSEVRKVLPGATWVPSDENLIATIETTRFGKELWPYLLAAVLALLLIEMVLARTGSRKETKQIREELAEA